MTHEEWMAEGARRFGEDVLAWRFVCPSCGHVAKTSDWRDAGAPETTAAFSCVGRWLPNPKEMCDPPGPCNYAGGGLFALNPVIVTLPGGKERTCFAFAEASPP
jgi:hypothetical protein